MYYKHKFQHYNKNLNQNGREYMKKREKIATSKNKFYQYKDKQYYEIAERNKPMKGVKKKEKKKRAEAFMKSNNS